MSGLLRIILIDTHLNGVVELKLDQHSNICGTNASGKTTLQRLIPVFYGEYPSRVVPSTRDSFERWYLPREASYIIYEYQQYNGQHAQVVLSSAREEQGVKYRFIGKPFELEDFIERQDEQGTWFLAPAKLGQQLKKLQHNGSQLATTRFLNTREYRAIIQNDRSLQNAGDSDLKAFARQFSMCDPKHGLRHIEKLAKAVHSKEGKMETIKSMIAAILEEEGVTLKPTWVDANKAQAWIRETRLIQQFAAIRPKFVKLEQINQQLLSSEAQLLQLDKSLQSDEQELFSQTEHHQRQLNQLKEALNELEQQWTKQRDLLNQTVSRADADVSSFDKQLNQIEDDYLAWQDKQIEDALSAVEQLPQWREQAREVSERHQLLTEQHSDIEAHFNQRKSEINEQLNNALTKLHKTKDQLQQQLNQERQQQQVELNNEQQRQQTQISQVEQKFQQQQHQHQLELAQLEAGTLQMGYTEDESRQLNIMDNRLDEASQQQQLLSSQMRQHNEQLQQLKQQRQHADQQLATISQQNRQLEQKLSQLKSNLQPEDGSLLAHLRSEHPQWEHSIGKLINPELLSRRDLKPHGEETTHNIFGLALDLKAIDAPECAATEQQIKLQIDQVQQRYQEAQKQLKQTETALADANKAVQAQDLSVAECTAAHHNSEDQLKRLHEEKQLLKENFSSALQQRQSIARQQQSKLKSYLENAQAQHQNYLEELHEQHQEAKLEKMAWWEEKVDALALQLSQAQDAITQRQTQAKQALKQSEQWYRGELQEQGLDDQLIIDLAKQKRQLNQQIQDAEQYRDQVSEYKIWHQQVWLSQKPQLNDALANARQQQSSAKQALGEQQAQFKQQRDNQQNQLTQLKQQVEQLEQQHALSQNLLRKIKQLALVNGPQHKTSGNDIGGSPAERTRQAEQQIQQRNQQLEQVNESVRHFDSLLAQQAGSDLSETWERSRAACRRQTEDGETSLAYRELVPHLSELLNGLVPQKVQGLIDHGRNLGMSISSFYQNLSDIDQRILSQSRRITREIGEDLSLDGVSDSAVKIRSKISELEFWDELKAFVENFQAWQQQGFNQLPNEDYANSMRIALDIIGRSALKEGVSRLLLIELTLREGNSDLVIRTDRQLNESSSHGMAYLILCKFLLAFTRLLRGNADTYIHWPIDELGTLHQSNVKKIFDACDHNQIRILGAFPNPESEVLDLFTHRYIIDRDKRQLQVVQPRVNLLQQKLRAAKAAKETKQQQPEAEL
ncbi:ATP-binding protein [Agarivorans sp. TSD2052]|uniref:ATP-binding protein n=1 Tax=Agarivorans sp. TSD2052 TaxID=2937286 RepID=UPI00200D7900|nr:ATP-binding protein [Agarivorans sp. TSD2052]UPW19283.1 ATP-binding protein [Agarivorans sp. TSD2052]